MTFKPPSTTKLNPSTEHDTYLLRLPPIILLIRQQTQIPKLQLQSRRLRRAHQTFIIRIQYELLLAEVDHGSRETGGRVERREDPVSEVDGFGEEELVGGEVVCGEEAAEHADGCLHHTNPFIRQCILSGV